MKKIKHKIIISQCNFECEMVIGPNANLDEQEVRQIYDESISMDINGKYCFISISNFRNKDGQTIGDFLLDQHPNFAIALSKKN